MKSKQLSTFNNLVGFPNRLSWQVVASIICFCWFHLYLRTVSEDFSKWKISWHWWQLVVLLCYLFYDSPSRSLAAQLWWSSAQRVRLLKADSTRGFETPARGSAGWLRGTSFAQIRGSFEQVRGWAWWGRWLDGKLLVLSEQTGGRSLGLSEQPPGQSLCLSEQQSLGLSEQPLGQSRTLSEKTAGQPPVLCEQTGESGLEM